jgi:hypothetical protein
MVVLSQEAQQFLKHSFAVRTTMSRHRSGGSYTLETTFVWDGGDCIYLSGYPGTRDWVANMVADPNVTVHIVYAGKQHDILSTANVLRGRDERMPHLLNFVNHWARRGGVPGWPFRFVFAVVRLNWALRLPWWGPFWFARRIFDRMPCVQITFTGEPTPHDD